MFRCLFLAALGFWVASSIAGCGKSLNKEESKAASAELPTLLHHDFRGKTLPRELMLLNPQEGKFLVEAEPEGLRIKIIKPWIPPMIGVGVKTAFGLKGDFEAIATLEMLPGDMPPPGQSSGVALFLSPVNYKTYREATAIDLFLEKGSQGIRWWATDSSRKGSIPCTDKIVRLGLKRTGATVHYLWARGMEGADLQEIGQADWPTDIEFIRLFAFLTKTPVNVEARLLELRIRGNRDNSPIINMAKGGIAGLLLIGMVITLSLALGAWLIARRRRRREDLTEVV